jgi:hypothetical protein
VTVRRVDHEDVDAHLDQSAGPLRRGSVDADRHRHHETARTVDGRCVDRAAQGTPPRHTSHENTVGPGDGGEVETLVDEPVMDVDDSARVGNRHDVGVHHVLQLREPVETGRVVLGEDSHRPALVDDHHCPVGPLVDERECLADRVRGPERDGSLEQRVARLDVAHHRLDDVERDVLGKHHEAAAPRHCLGHPPPGDRGHVRHHDRDARAETVGGGEVHIEPARDARHARHHEHVVVREVVRRRGLEEAHRAVRDYRVFVNVTGEA